MLSAMIRPFPHRAKTAIRALRSSVQRRQQARRDRIEEEQRASCNRVEEEQRVSRRHDFAMGYYSDSLARIDQWASARSEETNFLYDIDQKSRTYLAHALAALFGGKANAYRAYFHEIDDDRAFYTHVTAGLRKCLPDATSIHVGRRLGWYAIARAIKPRLIVETGVDFGLGSCLLSAALLRNASEGSPGRYIGTDIDPLAGRIYTEPYSSIGKIAYGDSIQTLSEMRGKEMIDLFINDSDHSAEYEAREYEIVAPILSDRAVILGDNSHVTTALADFSERNDRRFVFFKEVPKDHWYPGAGIGISSARAR
jgi:predicted O-methyltransferase YrrM